VEGTVMDMKTNNSLFGKAADVQKSFCPYRVCPLGAHIDHQHGRVTGFAIDHGITISYTANADGKCRILSANMDGQKEFDVHYIPHRVGDWADHLRGTIQILKRDHDIKRGINAYIEGSLPIGGLSASAAVIIAFMIAICKINNIKLTKEELISYAVKVENRYVGVNCGKLDQSTEIYSKYDHLMYLDTQNDEYRLISRTDNGSKYKIGIFFSGLPRSLRCTAYNARVDECKAAAYALKAFSGIEYSKFEDTYLRDVPVETFQEYKDRLPENWRKRAEHFYSENARVIKGAELWEKGDLAGFGKLINESGRSSIYSYETGSPQLKALYDSIISTDGIYGGRFSGGGFRGCCMGLIDPEYEEHITEKVTSEYLKSFPDMADGFKIYYCDTADGVRQ
jgi:galactokinase/galacturonokinase